MDKFIAVHVQKQTMVVVTPPLVNQIIDVPTEKLAHIGEGTAVYTELNGHRVRRLKNVNVSDTGPIGPTWLTSWQNIFDNWEHVSAVLRENPTPEIDPKKLSGVILVDRIFGGV